jgi:hypothetical protein
MSEELTKEAIDAAIILENKMRERVEKEVALTLNGMLRRAVKEEVQRAIGEEKHNMMMEISITVGKALRASEMEGRKPLWESTPEELGLDPADLNTHMISKGGEDHAIRKQT